MVKHALAGAVRVVEGHHLALACLFKLFLKDQNLLELTLNELLQFKNGLVALVTAQDYVELCERGLIFVELALHEGIVIHESLRSSDLLQYEVVQARGVVLAQHLVSASLDLVVALEACFASLQGAGSGSASSLVHSVR